MSNCRKTGKEFKGGKCFATYSATVIGAPTTETLGSLVRKLL